MSRKKKDNGTKFILIRDGGDEYTIIGEDGGYAGFHHNGECIVGTYYGRIRLNTVIKEGLKGAETELLNSDEERTLFDFDGKDDFELGMAEELADWMIAPREGEFYDNLKFFKSNKELSKDELVEFLKKKAEEYEHLFY